MSSLKVYAIRCNGCGLIYARPNEKGLLSETRANAEDHGWVHDLVPVKFGMAPSYDFCPRCRENGLRNEVLTELIVRMITKDQYAGAVSMGEVLVADGVSVVKKEP